MDQISVYQGPWHKEDLMKVLTKKPRRIGMIQKASKKQSTSKDLQEEKRIPEGLEQLCREDQSTIHDTPLSVAADNYTKALKENKLWKERLQTTKKVLVERMKEMKLVTMTMGQSKVIKYKWTAAKEDVVVSDYKAKSPSRNRYRR